MTALKIALQQIPGLDHEEFRNLLSYCDCGKTYQEALKHESSRTPSPRITLSAESSGVSSLSDEEVAKPSATTSRSLTTQDNGENSLSDEKVAKPSATTSRSPTTEDSGKSSLSDKKVAKTPTTTSASRTSSVISRANEQVATPSKPMPKKEAPLKVESRKERAKPRMVPPPNLRIMYRGRDILNLERNVQPHKWQLTSPLFGFLPDYALRGMYFRFEGAHVISEYKMKTCSDCQYYEPTFHLNQNF